MRRVRGHLLLRLLGWLLLVAVLAGLVAGGVVWQRYQRFLDTPLQVTGQQTTLVIPAGTSFRGVVDLLHRHDLSAAPTLYWRVLARQMGVTRSLDAGEYAVPAGMQPRALLHRVASNQVVQYRFTIVDGWTFTQLRQALDADPRLRHVTRQLDGAAIMQRLGDGDVAPEGEFLPETYAFTRGDSDLDLLRRAHNALRDLLARAWPERADDLPLDTPYEAMILASIVEKETARDDERARIAGVFVRRLRIGMPLQTDPTIIYGLGSGYDGNITRRDLKMDTPYNTYLHRGLPPTPIAMAGQPAIHAALHPAPGKALYFVARGDGSGRHVFSATLAEHNRAVACHQLHRCR